MDWYEEQEEVKKVKVTILFITGTNFETNKGWVKKAYCLYAHPPYLGQKIWVRENQLYKL
jgi:hypothetical protein